MPPFTFSLVAATLLLLGCGSAPRQLSEPQADEAPPAASSDRREPVQSGTYALRMAVPCGGSERTATGTLTLKRLSGSDASSRAQGEGALLWGQMDIDFEKLRVCLGGPRMSSEEPIHPSVLVEVLHWDGAPQQQVLLASTDRHPGGATPSGAGVALWVASVARGRIEGVWSRWELKRAVEGRFEAELTSAAEP